MGHANYFIYSFSLLQPQPGKYLKIVFTVHDKAIIFFIAASISKFLGGLCETKLPILIGLMHVIPLFHHKTNAYVPPHD